MYTRLEGRVEDLGWLSTIKESQKVTRQDSTPRTCAEMSLVEKLCGRGLQALLFKALFHCSQRFPAGLGHKCDPPPLSHDCTLRNNNKKNLGYISKSVYKDVFFLQPVLGRQLSSVSSGGQALQPAVLGQPAAEAERVEGEQSESHS